MHANAALQLDTICGRILEHKKALENFGPSTSQVKIAKQSSHGTEFEHAPPLPRQRNVFDTLDL